MIKLSKMLKESQDDWKYKQQVQDALLKALKGKKFSGWEFYGDDMAGTFEWEKGDYLVYATPFWDGNNGIPVDILNKDGDEIANLGYVSKFKPTGDLKKDVVKSVVELKKIFKMLDKNLAKL